MPASGSAETSASSARPTGDADPGTDQRGRRPTAGRRHRAVALLPGVGPVPP